MAATRVCNQLTSNRVRQSYLVLAAYFTMASI